MQLFFYKIPIFLDSDAAWRNAETWIVEAWFESNGSGAGLNLYDGEMNIVPFVEQDAKRYKDAVPLLTLEVNEETQQQLHTAVKHAREAYSFNQSILSSVAQLFTGIE